MSTAILDHCTPETAADSEYNGQIHRIKDETNNSPVYFTIKKPQLDQSSDSDSDSSPGEVKQATKKLFIARYDDDESSMTF